MTLEERQKILTNSVVKKLDGQKGWSVEAEEAIRQELNAVVVDWMEAAKRDKAGPVEVVHYLKHLNTVLMTSRLDENPDLGKEPDEGIFKEPT